MDEKKLTQAGDDTEALARDYDLGSLFGFVLPSIFTFIFISVYQVVDGLFIEKYVGPYAISALLSCMRTFVILSVSLFGLSALFGADGLWASWSVTEVLSLVLSILLLKYRSRYFE